MRIAKPIPEMSGYDIGRFWGLVDRKNDPDACWPWAAASSPGGYGRFKFKGALFGAHRVAYEIANGKIPPKMERCLVLHSCHNPACCNPNHLRLGTGSQNNYESVLAGRWARRRKASGAKNEA